MGGPDVGVEKTSMLHTKYWIPDGNVIIKISISTPHSASIGLTIISLGKGQLISECPFDVSNFPKNQRKIWQISA